MKVSKAASGVSHNAAATGQAAHDLAVGDAVETEKSWRELCDWLPRLLEQLLGSDVYGSASPPPNGTRGVYLFSELEAHLYVGRTSITARSRASGNTPITSFRHRYHQHTQPGRPPWAAALANRLMRASAHERGVAVTSDWWKTRRTESAEVYELFCEAKERVRAMDFRVVAFDDDLKGVRSSVAEIYVHTQLRTVFNDFSTS